MKTFDDLNQHDMDIGSMHIVKRRMFFPNGYGISVIRFTLAYEVAALIGKPYATHTDNEDEFECAVMKGNENESCVCYSTPITKDVVGHLTKDQVSELMKQIQELPICT